MNNFHNDMIFFFLILFLFCKICWHGRGVLTTLNIVFSIIWYFMSLWSPFLVNKFTSIVMNNSNLDDIHANY